jgi:subfamily B ATP-binding cassette protein HlyB/CyaB
MATYCALHQRSVDLEAIARDTGAAGPLSLDEFERIASQGGLEIQASAIASLSSEQCPIAVETISPSNEAASPAQPQWAVVLQVAGESAVVALPGQTSPCRMPLAEFSQRLTGRAIQLRPMVEAPRDPDAVPARRTFGFAWFVPELLKHRAVWRDVLIASLVMQLIALATPLFTQAIIDKVVVHRTQSTLIALSVAMALFITFTAILSWVRQYLILHTGNRVDAALGREVFEHLFKLPPLYFRHRPTGVVAARLQGIETIREFVSSAAVTLILDLPFLLIFVAVMLWYSVKLTLIVLAILGLIVAASALVAPLFRRRLNEQFLRGAASQAFLTEYVAGVETVKSLQLEPQLNRRYRDLLAAFLASSYRTKQLANSYNTFSNGLEQIMTLLVLVLGAWLVMTTPSFTIGMLVAFQMFASRLSQPMLRLVGLWQQFQQARIAVVRLGDIMCAPAEPYSYSQRRARGGKGAIRIRGLGFRYEDNLPLLYEGFDVDVAPGELVAIMGASGAGKSTLVKLLQGFYQPTQGTIALDDVDIRHLSANELRSYFGVVPQETTLFSGTILENLKIAQPQATFEQVVAACRMAEIHSVIEALPLGYETVLGERGAGLSGGQRQRLAIARALIKGPKILLFDEATSSLDGHTAEQLGRTINALKGKATIIFIAHILPRTLQPDGVIRIGKKLSVVLSNRGPKLETRERGLGEQSNEGLAHERA